MSRYSEFFLNSPSSTVQLELLEISHPSFSKVYRVVRNHTAGVTVTLEDGSRETFSYYPLRITSAGVRDDMDYGLTIDLGDLGEELPKEQDRVETDRAYSTKPTVRYWTYRSDDLSAPLFGPVRLEVKEFSFSREGATFEARAPQISVLSTGEVYKLERFPTLRSYI